MIRNVGALAQMEQMIRKVQNSSLSKHAIVRISRDLEVKIKRLSWEEFASLETDSLKFTVSKIVELAQEKFFDDLCIRFGVHHEPVPTEPNLNFETRVLHRGSSRTEVLGHLKEKRMEEREVYVLRRLSDGMVQRIAEIYKLVSSTIGIQTHALELGNVRNFLTRIHQEAGDVYGLYLGDGHLQEEYRLLVSQDPVAEEIIRFANEKLAEAQIDIHVPVGQIQEDRPHFAEVMSLELVTACLIYKLPLMSQAARDAARISLYIQGFGLVNYQIHSEVDLWSGLIAYRFCPVDQAKAPDICCVRGTQRRRDIAGFLGSMISVWHPLGPGGNALMGDGAQELERALCREGRKIIITGHSMGAEIAVTLAKKRSIQHLVERTYSFNNPGRNKHHMTGSVTPRVHHFINADDPVSYLGDFRDGKVSVIYSSETPLPNSFSQMVKQAHSIIFNNHCIPQTLGKRAWMAVEVRNGRSIGNFNPIWGFLHRFFSNTLYGPWKMVAIVSWVVWPIFKQIANWTCKSLHQVYVWVVPPINSFLVHLFENHSRPTAPQAST